MIRGNWTTAIIGHKQAFIQTDNDHTSLEVTSEHMKRQHM